MDEPNTPSRNELRRPESEVSDSTGLVGAATLTPLLAWVICGDGVTVGQALLLLLGGPAVAMILWQVLVERVHRRPSTGLDWSLCLPWRATIDIACTKLVGLLATFAVMGLVYFSAKTYGDARFDSYFILFLLALVPLGLLAPVYILLTTRRMVEPRDGLWHFGRFVCQGAKAADMDAVRGYLLAWAVKTFFLAFMGSILPGELGWLLALEPASLLQDPVRLMLLLVSLLFLYDVCFGTLGYIMTFRVLDSHIRSANPYLSGWVAALACYPPFGLMMAGGPLDYRAGTREWTHWFEGQDVLLLIWGAAIVTLAAVYAWATVVFGLRFSNLTHRGIITAGPYRFVRHPAYLSKNLMWWMIHLPFLSAENGSVAVQNCILLLGVNAIYYARAKTEERHLLSDPKYQAYCAWTAEHGLVARLRRALRQIVQGRGIPDGAPSRG